MARLPTKSDLGNVPMTPSRGATMASPVQERAVQVAPDQSTAMALAGAAEGLESFSVTLKRETEKLDKIVAEDALNKIRQERLNLEMGEGGALSVKGGNVLTPTYMSGYTDRFKAFSESVVSKLTPAQQALLKPHVDSEDLGFKQGILRHSMREAEVHKGIVREGSITTAQNAATMKWGSSEGFMSEIGLLTRLADETAKDQGIDPNLATTDEDKQKAQDTIIAMRQKAMSPAYAGAISAALDARDTKRAEELLAQGRLAIEPGVALKLQDALAAMKDTEIVRSGAADELGRIQMQNSQEAKFGAAATSALTDAFAKVESSGRQAKPDGTIMLGPVITDPKSMHYGQQAVGKYQIMPKTAPDNARAAGIPWNEKLFYDPGPAGEAYNLALHQGHMKRLQSLGLTEARDIAAAYYTGEGNVLKAKKRADEANAIGVRNKGALWTPVDYLDLLPRAEETKTYVSKVLSAYRASPGYTAPTEAEVSANMAARFPGRPDLAKKATDMVVAQVKDQVAAQKAEVDKVKDTLNGYMAQGKLWEEMPPSLVDKLPPKDKMEVEKQFRTYLTEKDRDSNKGLMQQINADPAYLTRIDQVTWNGAMKVQLSDADWKRLDKQRTAQLSGDATTSGALDTGTVSRVFASRFRMLDKDPNPKETDADALAMSVSARAVLDDLLLNEQKTLGRRFTEPELINRIDTAFSQDVKLRSTIFGRAYGEPDVQKVLTMKIGDLPSGARDTIKEDLVKRGVAKPTDTQILIEYKRRKLGTTGGQ